MLAKLFHSIVCLLVISSTANAAEQFLKMDFFGGVYHDTDFNLKDELKRDYPALNLNNAKILEVAVVAKSYDGLAEVSLQVGTDHPSKIRIKGTPHEFNNDSIYHRDVLYPRAQTTEPWTLRIFGAVKIKEVSVYVLVEPVAIKKRLNLLYSDRYQDSYASTSLSIDPAYRVIQTLGLVLESPAAGTRPLYGCQYNDDRYPAATFDCLNGERVATIGHVWTNYEPNRVALYTCSDYNSGEYYPAINATCNGRGRMIQFLGYADRG